jgi:NAD(P)-dependent dehydrogenase (short-subunit alcohol dehydrogenase family)
MQATHRSAAAPRRPVAVVTGARQGIGFGIAGALAAAGFDLVLLDRDWDDAAVAAFAPLQESAARIRFIPFDLARIERHEAVAEEAAEAFGVPDCLVNNAGVQVATRGDILDVEPDSFDRVLGINLRGTFFFTQAIARRMLTAGARQHHRSLVVVSSINAALPAADRAEYCLSKAALSMMTQLFALRLAQAGICAYEIRPGIIRTAMTAPAAAKYDALIAEGLTPIARWGSADDVGRTVATLAQGKMPFSTGQAFNVDGGLHIHRL